jgi:hypothetical protein
MKARKKLEGKKTEDRQTQKVVKRKTGAHYVTPINSVKIKIQDA